MGRQNSPSSKHDLSIFKDSDLRFPREPKDRIQSVDVRHLHLELGDNESEQLTLSLTVPQVGAGAIHGLLNRILNTDNVRLEEAMVSKVKLRATFVPDGNRPAETLSFEIGYPNRCTLKDNKNEQTIKECLKRWGVLNA